MNKIGLRKLNNVSEKYKTLFMTDINNNKILLEDINTCICCSGQTFEKLLEVDRFDLPFGSYICQDCGLITTSPRIKQESLPYYYEKYYHQLNYGKEDLGEQVALFAEGQGRKIYKKLEKYFSDKSKLDILEIGVGVGSVLDEFRTEAKTNNIEVNLLGTEYSSECINQCNNRNIATIQGNAQSVLAENRKFDVIILSHVFEHFIDLGNELNILKKLLKPDGLLYIEVPGILKNHNKPYYDFSFLGYSVHAHMYNFTLVTLKNIVQKYGFLLTEGNEEVEAVFQIKENLENKIENDYLRTKYYLDFLEDNQLFAIKQQKEVLKVKDISKFKQMIENRDRDINKFKQMIENRDRDINKFKQMVENRDKDINKFKQMVENRDNQISSINNFIKPLGKVNILSIFKYKKVLIAIKKVLGN